MWLKGSTRFLMEGSRVDPDIYTSSRHKGRGLTKAQSSPHALRMAWRYHFEAKAVQLMGPITPFTAGTL